MKQQKHTPLIAQFLEIKQQYPDALLFFQVGDFYELFFDDAITAAEYLAITLTKRGKANGQDIPLCGVPVHALSHYLIKLVTGGFTVAICDQLSKPQPGTVVKRAVTKVYTPGTLTDDTLLNEKSSSYLCTLCPSPQGTQLGLTFTELLTAHVAATTVDLRDIRALETELARFSPDEIVLPPAGTEQLQQILKKLGYTVTLLREHADQAPLSAGDLLAEQKGADWVASLRPAMQKQLSQNPTMRASVEVLVRYLTHAHAAALAQLTVISFYEATQYVCLDAATQRNLSVLINQEGGAEHTLWATLDGTQTPMGSRLLKKWLVRPLRDRHGIMRRQQAVAICANSVTLLSQLKEQLRAIGDLERVVGRIALRRATHADYLRLAKTLPILPVITQLLAGQKSELMVELCQQLPAVQDLFHLITQTLNANESVDGLIAVGADDELDKLRQLATNGQQEIQKLAAREAAAHDISSLKILYTSVAGYFIEVTKTHVDKVPEQYRQIQTLANRSRFITTELKELEQKLATAQEQAVTRDKELYAAFENRVATWVPSLRRAATALAMIDVLYGLAHMAYLHNYVPPTFIENSSILIERGRHPVIERVLNEPFVANDTALGEAAWLWMITGPNMGGKSTYLRQVALICLMAQCGSFVPAQRAQLPLLDRIFTRIGAGDNMAQGKSTFLVEMEESATICGQATKDSLVILDEVGRGTSTQDGQALAQAIVEYLAHTVKARTLFATHYHELTALSEQVHGIANYHVECRKEGETLHFLHTLAPGVATASFGIEVAQLAQLPKSVIARARELLWQPSFVMPATTSSSASSTANSEHTAEIVAELEKLDIDDLSPRAAFAVVQRLHERVKNGC